MTSGNGLPCCRCLRTPQMGTPRWTPDRLETPYRTHRDSQPHEARRGSLRENHSVHPQRGTGQSPGRPAANHCSSRRQPTPAPTHHSQTLTNSATPTTPPHIPSPAAHTKPIHATTQVPPTPHTKPPTKPPQATLCSPLRVLCCCVCVAGCLTGGVPRAGGHI